LRLHGAGAGIQYSVISNRDSVASSPPARSVYGSDAVELAALREENRAWNELLHPTLPYRSGEVIWAVRHEMARTAEDVLSRRTRLLLLDARASMAIAPKVAKWMAKELGRDERWERQQVSAYRKLAEGYLVS
jgi:glycerol-3-phosphate dehydrogenase